MTRLRTRPRGPQPRWQPKTARQEGILADLIERYQQHYDEDTLPRGPRGIFYDLRPHGLGHGVTYRKPDSQHPITLMVNGKRVQCFGEMEAHPAAVQEVLVLARRAGTIPEHWVADGRAPDAIRRYVDDDDAAAQAAYLVGRLTEGTVGPFDRQRYQPMFLVTLVESEDLMPRIARITGEGGVPVYRGSGFDGIKGKRAFAERAMERDRPTVVLNVGDRDDHGENIFRACAEDAIAWADGAGRVFGVGTSVADAIPEIEAWHGMPSLLFLRVGLTTAQAENLDILDADGKAEADAVPVRVMDGWLRDAIEQIQDEEARERLLEEERQQRELLPAEIRAARAELDLGEVA